MVRTAGSGARPVWATDYDDEEEEDVSEEAVSEDEYRPSKAASKSPRKKVKTPKTPKTPRGKISPSKTPASKRKPVYDESDEEPVSKKKKKVPVQLNSSRSSNRATPKQKYSYVDSDEDGEEESDYEEQIVAKKSPPKSAAARKSIGKSTPKSSRKAAASTPRSSGRAKKKIRYHSEEEEEDYDDDSDVQEIDDESEDEVVHRGKGGRRGAPPPPKYGTTGSQRKTKLVTSKEKKVSSNFPPVSEMVVDSILALKEPPRKGSTLRTIKDTIALNWPVNMRIYDIKIKKFLRNALETGEVILVKGNGLNGRFTVPGMKTKKKKARKSSLTKKFDEDEVEYQPKKTKRDEERIKDQEELERRRTERMIWEERVKAERAAERANRPKKPVAKKEEYEVEAIKGAREKDGKKYYLIQFVGYPKRYWEPEENVADCQALIAAFEEEEQKKKEEMDEIRRLAEEEGIWEVAKILEAKTKKDNTREFLIRWKGYGPEDDTWEPEENLDCTDLISSFMQKWEAGRTKVLREAPKPVQRLAFATTFTSRAGKRNHGFRVTYEGMDE